MRANGILGLGPLGNRESSMAGASCGDLSSPMEATIMFGADRTVVRVGQIPCKIRWARFSCNLFQLPLQDMEAPIPTHECSAMSTR